jgi:ABC-type sugar transport system permease subunit
MGVEVTPYDEASVAAEMPLPGPRQEIAPLPKRQSPPAWNGPVGQRRPALGGWWGFSGLMIAPALIMIVLFLIYPACWAFRVAMQNWSGFSPVSHYAGFGNFTKLFNVSDLLANLGQLHISDLFSDGIFFAALKNSIIWMLVGGLVHFFFGLVLATGLQNPGLRFKKFFQTMLIFPMFITAIGVAVLWRILYNPRQGLLNMFLSAFHLANPTNGTPAWLSSDHGVYPLLLVSVWGGVGGQIILILAGLRQIPASLYEAARIDGASEWQCFWQISLPLMRGILKIAMVLWIIESLQIFGLVQGMLGPDIEPRSHVVSTYMFDTAFNNRSNIYLMGLATAMAVVLVVITLVLILLLLAAYRLIFGKEKLEF